ncbi:MAG: SUMF1/EgtB/PvdO family nonheme iron enzyme [Planctomycetota bacterium]
MRPPLRFLIALLLLLGLAFTGPRAAAPGDETPDPARAGDGAGEKPKTDEPPPILGPDTEGPAAPEGPANPPEPAKPTYPSGGEAQVIRRGAPAGMVYVPGGEALIGTTAERLAKILTGRPKIIREKFLFEIPPHRVPVRGFYIDQYEVSNAQYLTFLQDAHVARLKTAGKLANLEEVAGHLLGLPRSMWGKKGQRWWRQLYEGNKKALHEAMPDLVVRLPGDKVDEEATAERFHRAPLTRGIDLTFYDLIPPRDWPGLVPAKNRLDHPVRYVSYNDAERFAEWAGKHIPTEVEWEYAARGPEGYFYPWGDEWFPDASHANWGGKIVERYRPVTVPVTGDLRPPRQDDDEGEGAKPWHYDGMSWCGVWHMLGNVAEWTSSWFQAYPGNDRDHKYMGEYVKVIRGAGLGDQERLALRLAARNFLGTGDDGPPRPANRFPNVGFRCAWYANPGQDILSPTVRRAQRGRRIARGDLALDRWAGAAANHFAATPESVENAVFVTGRSRGIVFVPMKRVFPLDEKIKIRKRNDLIKVSEGVEDPIPLGVLHTDVPLAGIYVRDRDAVAKKPKKRGRRRRTKPEPPPTKKGTCRAGTYLLAYWFGRLCIVQPSLEFVGFLSKARTNEQILQVKKVKPEALVRTKLEVTPVADLIEIGFSVPVGGLKSKARAKAKGGELRIVVDPILLDCEEGALDRAGTWKMGHAGAAGAGKPEGKPAENPADAEKPDAKPAEKPADAGKPDAKPAENPADAEKPEEKPADAGKPEAKPADAGRPDTKPPETGKPAPGDGAK